MIACFSAILVFGVIFLAFGGKEIISSVLGFIGTCAIEVIGFLGYPGIIILMAMESMVVPLPSELVMPFAGFLAEDGEMRLWLVILSSLVGSIIGSLISYYIGYYGGNKLVLKFGKYVFLDITDLEKTEKWFKKKGEKTILLSRFIPVVRHLISIPAGIGKMNLSKFIIYTAVGALVWNSALAYAGYLLGRNWDQVRHYSEYFSMAVAALLFFAGSYMIYRHINNKTKEKKALQELKNIK
jgi:membrane protein DedA with SNARE-associated domain